MSNMSYCRFTNTLSDLYDCQEALSRTCDYKKELSKEEAKAAERLLKLCRTLADDYGVKHDNANK